MPWIVIDDIDLLGCAFRAVRTTDPKLPDGVREVWSMYTNAAGGPVRRMTLIVVDGAETQFFKDEQIQRVFQAAQLLAFERLARRSLFRPGDYWNADHCRAEVAPCGSGIVAVSTRRRDGSGLTAISASGYKVASDAHASPDGAAEPDRTLLTALEAAMANEEHAELLSETLFFFNRANTDDSMTPPAMELVLMSGALQRLLGVQGKSAEHDIARAFHELLSPQLPNASMGSDSTRPEVRSRHGQRKLYEAWVRDLYRARHHPAHGRSDADAHCCWSVAEHLLMASFMLPRLVLLRLQEWGVYELTATDRMEVRAFDRLLRLDNLFRGHGPPGAQRFAWNDAFAVIATVTDDNGIEEDQLWPKAVANLAGDLEPEPW